MVRMNSAHERNLETACQAWWVEKDLFLPMFPYEHIALHDPANMYTPPTLKQGGGSEAVGGLQERISGKKQDQHISPADSGALVLVQ